MGQKSRGQELSLAGREDSARAMMNGEAAAAAAAAAPSMPMSSVSSPEPRRPSRLVDLRLVELALSLLIWIRISASEIYRRAEAEFIEELPLFKRRWKVILALASWQYLHGALSQLAHRLHTRPLPQPLRDAGFELLPELGPRAREWASEAVFSALFASFVAWSFSPFFRDSGRGGGSREGSSISGLKAAAGNGIGVGNGGLEATTEQQQQQQEQQRSASPPPPPPPSSPTPILPAFLRDRLPTLSPPRFYTCVLYGRVLTTLCACQLLRALSFLSTSLPGPNYHCRAGSPAATLPMPRRWWGHLVVDVGEQATKGCGDLIFSSHTTFALVGCLAYSALGNSKLVARLLWAAAVALSLLIVASRKHYTVDVVVAWYVVPLVWSFASRRWTTPERGGGGGVLGGGGGGGANKLLQKLQLQRQRDRPFHSSLIAASSSSGFDADGHDGDVESGRGGGLPCGTCPSCGGATATAAAATAATRAA